MRVLLPGGSNVVSVAEKTLVAMDEFWDGLAGVVATPGGGVGLGEAARGHKQKERGKRSGDG